MEFFLLVLLLLGIISLSSFINHLLPYIPVPLIQIALGVLLASLPLGMHVPMDPELFFVLFIAPLLFYDGKNVSRRALWKLRKPILLLALGLVFATVFVIGFLIHWLVPSIPLPAAFALAAILSPTDVVAVGAISSRVKIPKTIMHILEGEGLMNDASGLVAFKFAVAATVTGVFSIVDAGWSFLVISIGGLAGGAFLAYLVIRLKIFIRRLGMEDVTIHMLIQILTPFVIYYLIEHFHFSGILSVVAAGIVHGIYRDRDQSPSYQLQTVSRSTWTVLIYILNGLVFVLLGLQIPAVTGEIFHDPLFNNWEACLYIFIIAAALFLLRFIWISSVWILERLLKEQVQMPSFSAIGILTISGVRGAVTLAGAFTIPYVLADGSPFPERSLLLFIAAGVILATLLVASICLPILARTEKAGTEERQVELERTAMLQTIEAAIQAVRELMNDENRGAAVSVIANYNKIRNRISLLSGGYPEQIRQAEMEVRMKALDAEADYIEKLVKTGQIDRDALFLAQEYVQRIRLAITNRMRFRRLFIWSLLKRTLFMFFQRFSPKYQERVENRRARTKKALQLRVIMAKAAIRFLKKQMTPENESIYLGIIGEYNDMITKLKQAKTGEDHTQFNQAKRELQLKAFQAERDHIQTLYEEGNITIDIIRKIRKQINIREAYWEEKTIH
ncbi:Na+/H+ antiporter [Neobacillus dielmonensis]|uniref:Na+/H+ antiporter n=1 Tax=Neobacillus dielmonensis TaxID=1347369 RepID=UPI0005A8C9CF|nr:Na+/H+ antiporter [Neobacillus dielmonensis]